MKANPWDLAWDNARNGDFALQQELINTDFLFKI